LRSNYLLAGFESLASILERWMTGKKAGFNSNFTRECISNFHKKTMYGFLHSFGQNFSGRKSYKKYVKDEAEIFNKCRRSGFYNDGTFFVDSGGYQASIGKLQKKEVSTLVELYHEFLENECDSYDRGFILDLTPGPGCELFTDFKQVYDLNLQTYTRAANMPEKVRKKIVYIQHFRTPKLYETFNRLLKENDFFSKFDHFATGGMVASSAAGSELPCMIYVIPLIQLINEALKHNRKNINFHILGGAGFKEILYYELIQKHVKKVHDIELIISYDSSGIFKGLMIGRVIPIFYENILYKLDLRTNNINMRFKDKYTGKDIFLREIKDFAINNNFKVLNQSEIYDDSTGTFFEDIKIYSMLYMLEIYSKIQTYMKDFADVNYKLYEEKDFIQLNTLVNKESNNLADGRITNTQRSKSNSLINTLDMLTNLDEDYCQYIVKKVLSKDEFTNLTHKPTILSF